MKQDMSFDAVRMRAVKALKKISPSGRPPTKGEKADLFSAYNSGTLPHAGDWYQWIEDGCPSFSPSYCDCLNPSPDAASMCSRCCRRSEG